MKKFIIIFVLLFTLLFVIFINCAPELSASEDDSSYGSRSVYNDTKASDVKKLILLISLKIDDDSSCDGDYIVLPGIKDLKIKLNNKLWGTFDSATSDITDVTEDIYKGFPIRSTKFEYLVIAGYPPFDKTSDITAGDYSDYLNGVLDLGDYICEISELIIQNNSNVKTIWPHIFDYFVVEEGQESLYLGSYEILVSSLD